MQKNKVLPLKINGHELPMHSVYLFENVKTYTEEPSRSLDFSVAFTPKAFIPLVTVTWAMMKIEDYEKLISRIAPDEITLKYSDTEEGTYKTGKFYAQRPTVERNIALEGDFMYVRNVKVVFASTMSEPPETFTITYNANGGTSTIPEPEQVVYAWNEFTVASANESDISRVNYVFQKWNTQPDGSGTDFAPDSNRVATSDITLYAIWEEYFQVSEGLSYIYSSEMNGYIVSGRGSFNEEHLIIPSSYDNGVNGVAPVVAVADYSGLPHMGGVFKGRGIKSVIFPNTIRYIGDGSFSMNNISYLRIPDSVERIGAYAFQGNEITSLSLDGKNLKTILYNAFYENNINTVFVDAEHIGAYAFDSNPLETLYLSESVLEIRDGAFQSFGSGAGLSYYDFNLPKNLERLGDYAFLGNDLRGTITIPRKTIMGSAVFADNSMLNKVIFKSEEGWIRERTFADTLHAPTLPFTITIPAYSNIGALGVVPLVHIDAFPSGSAKIQVRVRPELVSRYKSATNWSDPKFEIKAIGE